MKRNPLNKGVLTDNSAGIGPVTGDLVRARTRELALIAGRATADGDQADHDRAQRELAGGSDMDRQDEVLDALPEAKRWDSVPGSAGNQVPESPSEDEDDEGRSETEQLVDEGAMEAERDRLLQAARASGESERRESVISPRPELPPFSQSQPVHDPS